MNSDKMNDLQPIVLPRPKDWRGKSVYAALKARQTNRSLSDKKLSLQTLSNLLWAANGVNRKTGPFKLPGRTAASASNSREIDVYAALEKGVFHYEPEAHRLDPAAKGDLRSMAIGRGQEKWGANAPVRLIYVADIDKFKTSGFDEPRLHDPEGQKAYYYADTGLIAGNVYLFAAAQGLAAWFHNCDREGVAKELNLPESKRPLFGQTVGYPGKTKE
ncbi:MAG TPA: nitroreductase family protein [Chitinivibrionales bacterium]|nr:nitroreductase family protein [Chitinivibrionales bacterium]